jgi:EAL domain-containing protein (putative c-di-GMP-specific phosphodiesterase class I)
VYLCPPLSHTKGTLARFLGGEGIEFSEPIGGILRIGLRPGLLDELCRALPGLLNELELADTRSLVVPSSAAPTLADLAAMQPLAVLLAKVEAGWLLEMLRSRSLACHYQPIVHASAPDRVFGFECLLRGLDPGGGTTSPGRMYAAARSANLLFHLDRMARLTAIRESVRQGLGRDDYLFINFNPSSIYDPEFCLRSTVEAIRASGLSPGKIVFEVVESDKADRDLARILRYYRDAGFRVALDDLGSGYGSLNLLHALRPDFVKLDMELIRGVDGDPYKAGITSKLIDMASSLGVTTVAEGVETESEWRWARDHGVDLVQGYLLATPACPPPAPRRIESVARSQALLDPDHSLGPPMSYLSTKGGDAATPAD